MVNIKSTISFDEFYTIIDNVVNSCFIDGEYFSSYYELTLRVALIKAFAPDYEIPTATADNYNDVWETVTSKEANEILATIRQNSIYPYIEEAIENKVDYKIKLITSSPMSMSDIALSNLFDVITKKVESIDTSILTEENMNTVINAVNATQDGSFAENLVDTMLDKGLLSKPKKTTKSKSTKTSDKKSNSKNITVTSKESDN